MPLPTIPRNSPLVIPTPCPRCGRRVEEQLNDPTPRGGHRSPGGVGSGGGGGGNGGGSGGSGGGGSGLDGIDGREPKRPSRAHHAPSYTTKVQQHPNHHHNIRYQRASDSVKDKMFLIFKPVKQSKPDVSATATGRRRTQVVML